METMKRKARKRMFNNMKEKKKESKRCGPRQQDIVQIAESGDIDHRDAAIAEISGVDTSNLSIPLESLPPLPALTLSLSSSFLIFRFRAKRQDSFSPDCYTLKIFYSNRRILEIYYSK